MRDPRYDTVKALLQQGEIKTFSEIFDWIPKSVVRQDLSTSNKRITKLSLNPGGFKLQDIYQIAILIGYDPKKLLLLAAAEYATQQTDTPEQL
jgi:hypothetical protein